VNFEITGGRIIGVGNGDPGCHEPDKFTETIGLFAVVDWRGRIAPAGTTAPAKPELLQPFPVLGYYQAPLPKPGEVYDLSGTFTLPAVPGGTLELFLPTLGAKTTLWLNGRELARDIDTSKVGPALRLDPAQLVAGVNRLQLIVTPFGDKLNHIPELTQLGSMRAFTSAPPARRSLFNGLAQVIVQSTREPGVIRLTAKSDGLALAESTVTARAATLRAAVP
jgi:beta-galactosidase